MIIALESVELSNGGIHLLIKGKIDDVELRFVVDTGASHSVMDIHWARLNLDEDDFILVNEPAHGIGSSVEVHRVNISNMLIGELMIHDRLIALIDFSSINAIYSQEGIEEVHGIIGGDILKDYHAIIDYKKEQLKFQKLK